jgi:hypothetical protein
MSQKSSEKNKKTNFHVIDLQWAHQMMPDYNDAEVDVDIRVTSRKIKNQTVSPPDILFRTHHYEFEMKPNQKFLSCYQKGRYVVELKLLKNVSHLKRKLYFDSNGQPTQSPGEDSPPSSPVTPDSSVTPMSSSTSNSSETPFDAPLRALVQPPASPSSIVRQPPTPPVSAAFPIIPKAVKSYQQLQQSKPVQPPTTPDIKKNGSTTPTNVPSSPSTLFMLPQQPPIADPKTIPPSPQMALINSPGTPIRPIPIAPRPQASPSRSNCTMPSPSKHLHEQSAQPSTPISSTNNYESPFDDILNSCDPSAFVIRSRDQSLEYREFTESDMPVVTYSFTEDSVNSLWNLNLIWPVDRRQLSWRGKFVFFVRIFKRVNHDTYSHMMSKISSPFCIFSKPDVYLKKIRKESGKKSSPSSDAEESSSMSSQEIGSQGSLNYPLSQSFQLTPPPQFQQMVTNGAIAVPTPVIPMTVTSFNRFPALKHESQDNLNINKRKRSPPSDNDDDEQLTSKERIKRRFVNGGKHNKSKIDESAATFLAFVESQRHVHNDENSNTDSSDHSNSAFSAPVRNEVA